MKHAYLIAALLTAQVIFAVEYRIEPEFFGKTKNWEQYTHYDSSGKGLLLSHNTSKNSISETFSLPQGGKFFVWVRTLTYDSHSRKCKIFINDKEVGIFGDATVTTKESIPLLKWEKSSMNLDIPTGKFTLKIVPLSDYVRIDSIILSTEPAFVPDEDAMKNQAITELKCAKN